MRHADQLSDGRLCLRYVVGEPVRSADARALTYSDRISRGDVVGSGRRIQEIASQLWRK